MNKSGIEFKIFIEEILQKKDKIVKFNIGDRSVVLSESKEIKTIDPVEEALTRIDESSKRIQKRQILNQYSLHPEKPWGVLNKADIRRKVMRNPFEQTNKIYNLKAGGYVNRDDYNLILRQVQNEQVLADKGLKVNGPGLGKSRRLTSMNVYEKTEKFENSTKIENVKKRINDKVIKKEEEEKKSVIPLQAMNTLAYFEDEQDLDKLIDLYKKKTDFDDGVKRELFATLQSDKYSKNIKQHLPTSEEVIDYLHGWNRSNRNLKSIDDGSAVPKGDRIQLESQKGFTTSKISTGYTDVEIYRRHRVSKMKKIDKLRYGAEHFYNTNNNENILYEKDGEISKMKQFDYKIHKPIVKGKLKSKNENETSIMKIQS